MQARPRDDVGESLIEFDELSIHLRPDEKDAYETTARLQIGDGDALQELTERRARHTLPPDTSGWARLIEWSISESRNFVQRSLNPERLDRFRSVGSALFSSLFESPLAELLAAGRERTRSGRGLRLRIAAERPLDDLPWEFLFEPQRNDFIALAPRTSLVRSPEPPSFGALDALPPLSRPLLVLVLTADVSTEDRDGLGIGPELELLRELEKQSKGALKLIIRENVSASTFLRELRNEGPDVLYFIGIARRGSGDGEASLVMAPEDGVVAGRPKGRTLITKDGSQEVSYLKTADLLGAVRSQATPVRFAFFNGCWTYDVAKRLAPWVGATLGTRGDTTNNSAIRFAEGLWRALVKGRSLDAAVSVGRRWVMRDTPGRREWGLPVLFVRGAVPTLAQRPTHAFEDFAENVGPSPRLEDQSPDLIVRQRLLNMHRKNRDILEDQLKFADGKDSVLSERLRVTEHEISQLQGEIDKWRKS